ncbi:MAG: lamin tail domain-containing protein [Haloarculaceae archaeon]
MAEDLEQTAWWTTDHELIREFAEAHDARPTLAARDAEPPELRVETDDDYAGDPVAWDRFFAQFDDQDQALYYRGPAVVESNDPERAWNVVDRRSVDDRFAADENTEQPPETETNQLALSDTGEAEPVTYERTDTDEPTREAVHEASTADLGDDAAGPTAAADQLVVDAIRAHRHGVGDDGDGDEHVVLKNAGEAGLDLSGWLVGNGDGERYRLPDGIGLAPGETLTVHRGAGTDGDGDLYWGLEESVWSADGGSVVVETPDGRRAVEQSYST